MAGTGKIRVNFDALKGDYRTPEWGQVLQSHIMRPTFLCHGSSTASGIPWIRLPRDESDKPARTLSRMTVIAPHGCPCWPM